MQEDNPNPNPKENVMMLDHGYRCETCSTKVRITLWHTISPTGKTNTEKILCKPDATALETRGWRVESTGISNEGAERGERVI